MKTATKQTTSIGILGYGEVGQAIAKFYRNPRIKDLARDDGLRGVDVLHISIPWNETFIGAVEKEIREIKPKLTIIHSTVAVGTTKKLCEALPDELIVHSPVRGVHPHIHEGIKTFVKYVGAENKKAGELAKKHLESIGIKTKVFMPAATTELGKLLDTTYYGLAIAFHGEVKKMCDKWNLDFDEVMTDFNKTYNEGYLKLGKKNVVRPVLYPPEDGIHGHCVIENIEILKRQFPSTAFEFISEYKPRHKK
ncbi:MAG: hypothetical protein HY001_04715 [Candidatus Portnoybacteria bacterium]|nr:hypothetical protein [Candidatus Portnoybacteria bacterium]